MKIVIVGMGRIGTTVVEELCKEGHDIVAIDNDAEKIQDCVNRFDILGVTGNGCSAEILREAGVEKCDMLVAVTPHDEYNLLCCVVAKALGAKHLVARVRDPEYDRSYDFLRKRLGIQLFINPEETASQEILRILRFPAATKVTTFSNGKVEIVEFKVPEKNALAGLSLIELRKRINVPALIVTIEREGKLEIPGGTAVIKAGDVVNVCATQKEIKNFFRAFGLFQHKAQTVIILGGGDDVFYLARELVEREFFVKIICNSMERCEEIKGELEKAVVVFGDYTDREVLEREGVATADAVVSMSHYDENNIVTSLFAKAKGAKKTITTLRGDSYRGILESIHIDTAISPHRLAATEITRYLRALDVQESSGVKAMYKFSDDRAEALLFNVGESAQFAGVRLKDLPLHKGILLAAVVRGKTVCIPDGNFSLETGDELVVISSGKPILELEDMLQS